MKSTEYYSNGKFLLTGEYLILDGALSLAVPLRFGQKLIAHPIEKKEISFKTYQFDRKIYDNLFEILKEKIEFECCPFSNAEFTADMFIHDILNAIYKIKPEIFNNGWNFISELNFNINWGLGSSSSLIANLALWAGIDKFELFKKVSNGSGYDIFAAQSNQPILYQIVENEPTVTKVSLNEEPFKNVFFVYLGQKQNSYKEVSNYKKESKINQSIIDDISVLTKEFISLKNENELGKLMLEHELLISWSLKKARIKQVFFSDFDGEIKSLGAWGGDFVMAYSSRGAGYIYDYFENLKLPVIFHWDEIIK